MFSTFPLWLGQEEYFLCWRLDDLQRDSGKPSAVPFFDHVSAYYFLRSVIGNSGQMHDLRVWLSEHNYSFLTYTSDDELMTKVAVMLASGELSAAITVRGLDGTEIGLEGSQRPEGTAGGKKQSKHSKKSRAETTPLEDEMARNSALQSEEELSSSAEDSTEPEELPLDLSASVDADLPPALAAQPNVDKLPGLPADAKTADLPATQSTADAGEEYPEMAAMADVVEIPLPGVESQSERSPDVADEAETQAIIGKKPSVDLETESPAALASETHIDEMQRKLATESETEDKPQLISEMKSDDTTPALTSDAEAHAEKKPSIDAAGQQKTLRISSDTETGDTTPALTGEAEATVEKKPAIEAAGPQRKTPLVSSETETGATTPALTGDAEAHAEKKPSIDAAGQQKTLRISSDTETSDTTPAFTGDAEAHAEKKPSIEAAGQRHEETPRVSSETETSQTPELKKETSASDPPRLDSHADAPHKHPKLGTELDADESSDDHHD